MKSKAYPIEPLESRIAPALLVQGANLFGGENPSTGESSIGEDSSQVIKVISGMALVWWDSVGKDILGISLSDGARIEVNGDIEGDIVGNLTSDGRLSDSDADPTNGEDGALLLDNDIAGIKIQPNPGEEGSVFHIITGGSISDVQIEGEALGLYAGDGVFDADSSIAFDIGPDRGLSVWVGIDINPIEFGFQGTFEMTLSGSDATIGNGGSITRTKINTGLDLQLIAGDGDDVPAGAGGDGGGIFDTTIKTALATLPGDPSYLLKGGAGGDGLSGGAGGSINKIVENSASQSVMIIGGPGGAGTAGSGGNGGAIGGLNAQSGQVAYTLDAGDGGAGGGGGAGGDGGSIDQNSIIASSTTSIVKSGDFNGDGFDDVLVVDPSSGNMVLSANVAGSSDFVRVDQPNGDPLLNPYILSSGGSPSSVAIGDLDNDFDLDIAVAYAGSKDVGVYLNDGAGIFALPTFIAGTLVSTVGRPVAIAVGDFSGSIQTDIAVVSGNSEGTTVQVLEGDGTGAFVSADML